MVNSLCVRAAKTDTLQKLLLICSQTAMFRIENYQILNLKLNVLLS